MPKPPTNRTSRAIRPNRRRRSGSKLLGSAVVAVRARPRLLPPPARGLAADAGALLLHVAAVGPLAALAEMRSAEVVACGADAVAAAVVAVVGAALAGALMTVGRAAAGVTAGGVAIGSSARSIVNPGPLWSLVGGRG